MTELLLIFGGTIFGFLLLSLMRIIWPEFVKRRNRNKPFDSKQGFVEQLVEVDVEKSVAEGLWTFFSQWMVVPYPLRTTDIVNQVVQLDDRELMDALEEMSTQVFSRKISIPDEFLAKTTKALAIYMNGELKKHSVT